jgi:putative spermidine/putrescine transport system substrate-binding protein
MLKSMIRTALPMLAVAATALAASWSPAMAKELRVLAWQGYADDDWVKEFEKESGADVKVVFIGSDDEIWAKIKGSEGKDFDVMAVNTGQLQRYIDAKLV